MAVTQRQRTVVNSARKNAGRRKLSPAQKAAGFGGKRAKAAVTKPRHSKPKRRKPMQHNKPRKSTSSHRPRTVKAKTNKKRRSTPRKVKTNLGKIISWRLPKESSVATTTKKNRSRKNKSYSHRPKTKMKKNSGHRRRTHRNTSIGDVTGLVTSAVFTVAGAVGTQQLTQMVLQANNTGIMGYFGNLVAAFILSYGVKLIMKNDKAATAVLAGGFVQIVLRLIADYTPFGSYTSSLGMGDYLAQNFMVPQRMVNGMRSAQISLVPTLPMSGMSGCGDSLYGTNSQYAA